LTPPIYIYIHTHTPDGSTFWGLGVKKGSKRGQKEVKSDGFWGLGGQKGVKTDRFWVLGVKKVKNTPAISL